MSRQVHEADGIRERVALVTGGASGMGRATAAALASRGARVAVLDVDAPGAREVADSLPRLGGDHMAVEADVRRRSQVESAIQSVSDALGPPTILVNGAGVLRPTRFPQIDDEEWELVVGVSLTGTFLCAQSCLPAMVAAGFGRIVNISSSAGRSVSTLGGAHYTSAKAGVLGFTRALAKEVAGLGITVNAVCPGLIDTAMVRAVVTEAELARYGTSFPVGRVGEAWEVAALVVFLCSDGASYITGASIDINGGDLMV